ncbi:MAG: GFA family protein [bacterium]
MKNNPYTGQCLCGSISYEVDEIEPRMGHCHCSMCRKFHGSAFATLGEVKAENFRWVKGESLLESYIAKNGTVRRFCKVCGSSMTFASSKDTGKLIEFSLGTLDSEIDMRPDAHIFVGTKAGWYKICDDLPQYQLGRNSD